MEGGILAWHKDRQLLDTDADGCAAVKNRRAMQEALPIHDSAKKRKWTTRRDAALPARDGLAKSVARQFERVLEDRENWRVNSTRQIDQEQNK